MKKINKVVNIIKRVKQRIERKILIEYLENQLNNGDDINYQEIENKVDEFMNKKYSNESVQ